MRRPLFLFLSLLSERTREKASGAQMIASNRYRVQYAKHSVTNCIYRNGKLASREHFPGLLARAYKCISGMRDTNGRMGTFVKGCRRVGMPEILHRLKYKYHCLARIWESSCTLAPLSRTSTGTEWMSLGATEHKTLFKKVY